MFARLRSWVRATRLQRDLDREIQTRCNCISTCTMPISSAAACPPTKPTDWRASRLAASTLEETNAGRSSGCASPTSCAQMSATLSVCCAARRPSRLSPSCRLRSASARTPRSSASSIPCCSSRFPSCSRSGCSSWTTAVGSPTAATLHPIPATRSSGIGRSISPVWPPSRPVVSR